MKRPPAAGSDERLAELLADRTLFGLDDAEEKELAALMAADPNGDHDAFDRIAAALAVSRLSPAAAAAARPPRVSPGMMAAAVATLAASLLAVAAWPTAGDRPAPLAPGAAPPHRGGPPTAAGTAPAATFARARDEMLGEVDDVVRLDFKGTAGGETAAASDAGPHGDIVWSPSRQRGFLRIRGLPRNDPREKQYQIWIVVGRRTVPVRGGVFDVAAADEHGDVVVPILPLEFVHGPTTFAVTAEKPGGAESYSAERARAVARAD